MTQWITGWNVPGYLPDDEPYAHATFEEARSDLIEELERAADDFAEEQSTKPYMDAIKAAQAAESEEAFAVQVGNYVWWINRGFDQ